MADERGACIRLLTLSLIGAIACDSSKVAPSVLNDLPPVEVTSVCRIDGYETDLVPVHWVQASPSNSLALLQSQTQSARIFDQNCRSMGEVGRKGSGPGEFQRVVRGGWMGDSLWLSDTRLQRITVFSPSLEAARTISVVPSVRVGGSAGAGPVTYTIAAPYALYSGDTILMNAALPNVPDEQSEAVPSSILIRQVPGGQVEGPPLALPGPDEASVVAMGPIPFYPKAEWALAPDGSSLAEFTVSRYARAADTVRVKLTAITGAKIWEKAFRVAPVSIPSVVADSAVTARTANRMRPVTPAQQAEMRDAIPSHYPPADFIVVGADNRIWIGLPPLETGKPWVVLDASGELLGQVILNSAARIAAATSDMLWTTEYDSLGVPSLEAFRYSVRTK